MVGSLVIKNNTESEEIDSIPFYFRKEKIDGCWKYEDEETGNKYINIILNGDMYTLLYEDMLYEDLVMSL